jgi:hypothetical protein
LTGGNYSKLRIYCSAVPLFRCSAVPLFRCSAVPLFRCSAVPLFRCCETAKIATPRAAQAIAISEFLLNTAWSIAGCRIVAIIFLSIFHERTARSAATGSRISSQKSARIGICLGDALEGIHAHQHWGNRFVREQVARFSAGEWRGEARLCRRRRGRLVGVDGNLGLRKNNCGEQGKG